MKSPVLVLAVFFALGILLAQAGFGSLMVLLPACAACLAAAYLLVRSRRLLAAGVLVLAGFVFAGSAAQRMFQRRFPADHVSHLEGRGISVDRPLRVQGMVATNPLRMPYGLQFDLAVSGISDGTRFRSAVGKVRLRVVTSDSSPLPAAALELRYGGRIRAWARMRRPEDDRNPGGFDYRRWMESIQDIYWQGVVEGPGDVQKLSGPGASFLGRAVASVRARLIASIDRMYPPWSVEGRDGAVLKAILLGDRSSLDSSTIEDFRRSGLYHLLVVAGLHVGLLAFLAEGLLRLLRVRAAWRVVLLLAFLCGYAALVEQRAPTLRASLMIGAYLVARLLDRDQPAMNAIGIAALALLFYRPAWLFDSGFQLSFAAALLIAGLAVPALGRLTEPYRRALRALDDPGYDAVFEPRAAQFRLDVRGFAGLVGRRRLLPGGLLALEGVAGVLRLSIWIAEILIFSAILQLGLLLPMAEIFHRVTLSGIGLNALAVPLMTVLLAIAVPAVLLGVFSSALAGPPARLLAVAMKGLFALTEWPHMPHWLSFRIPAPPLWVALGFILAVIGAAYGLRFHRIILAAAGAGAVAFGLIIALYPFRPRIPNGVFQVTQLDCGGGEGLFIVLPGRTTVLVGAGGGTRRWFGGGDPLRSRRWDPGENVVSPYLWSRGIKSIDALLLPDAAGDHLNGVSSVLRNFRVKQFWHGDFPPWPESRVLLSLLRSRGVSARSLEPGAAAALGDGKLEVLWPPSTGSAAGKRRTETPLLVQISAAEGSLLLAADLNRTRQAQALQTPVDLASTILEASSARAQLISRVNPAIVLETSYPRNRVDEPQAAYDGASKQGHRMVFNVAQTGAVTVSIAGGKIGIWSYASHQR